MPPEVKSFSPEIPVEKTGYFWLQMDSKKSFDPKKFDELALSLRSPVDSLRRFRLKWIVRGEKMIFFPIEARHGVTNYGFEYREDPGELRAAGLLNLQLNGGDAYSYIVYGNSLDLDELLGRGVSDRYRTEVLPGKLNHEGKEYFKFG